MYFLHYDTIFNIKLQENMDGYVVKIIRIQKNRNIERAFIVNDICCNNKHKKQ